MRNVRRLLQIATASLALVSTGASFAQQQSPAVAEIVDQLRQAHTNQALLLAKQALATHPGDCQLLSLEAVAFTGMQQQDAALHAFEHALARCPAYLPALEGAAQIEFARKAPGARPLLERILAAQPGNLPAQAMLASLLQAGGDCAAALPHLKASQELFTSHPELLEAYGRCLAATGDLPGAIAQYQALAAAHPSDAFQYDLAVLEWRHGEGQQAMTTLGPVLSAGQFEPAFALASRLAESLGDTPRAVELLRSAILQAPDDPENYLAFANLCFVHSSFQVGVDMLGAGLKRQPSAAPLYVARGVLEVQLSKQTEAITDFETAHRLDPKLALSLDALGIVQTQQHQDVASLKLFREQAKENPGDPVVQYLFAEQLAEGQTTSSADLADAIAAARQATLLDPHYQAPHDLLAKLYVRAGQPRLAVQQAELALADDPNDQEALYQELMARRRSGDAAEVHRLVERLNAVRKENAQKQQALDRYRLVEGAAP